MGLGRTVHLRDVLQMNNKCWQVNKEDKLLVKTSVRLKTRPSVPTVLTATLRWTSARLKHDGQWHCDWDDWCTVAIVEFVKLGILLMVIALWDALQQSVCDISDMPPIAQHKRTSRKLNVLLQSNIWLQNTVIKQNSTGYFAYNSARKSKKHSCCNAAPLDMVDVPCCPNRPLASWPYCCQTRSMKSGSAFETWVHWTPLTSRALAHGAAGGNWVLGKHKREQTAPGTVWTEWSCTASSAQSRWISPFNFNQQRYQLNNLHYNLQVDNRKHFYNMDKMSVLMKMYLFLKSQHVPVVIIISRINKLTEPT